MAWQVLRESLFEAKNVRGNLVTFRGSLRELCTELTEDANTTQTREARDDAVEATSWETPAPSYASQHDSASTSAPAASLELPSTSRPRSSSSVRRRTRTLPSLASVLQNLNANAEGDSPASPSTSPQPSSRGTTPTTFNSKARTSLSLSTPSDDTGSETPFSPIGSEHNIPSLELVISLTEEPSQIHSASSSITHYSPSDTDATRYTATRNVAPDGESWNWNKSRSRSSTVTLRDSLWSSSPHQKGFLDPFDHYALGPGGPREDYSFSPTDPNGTLRLDTTLASPIAYHSHVSQGSPGRLYTSLWWNDSTATVVEENNTPIRRRSSFSLPWMSAFNNH